MSGFNPMSGLNRRVLLSAITTAVVVDGMWHAGKYHRTGSKRDGLRVWKTQYDPTLANTPQASPIGSPSKRPNGSVKDSLNKAVGVGGKHEHVSSASKDGKHKLADEYWDLSGGYEDQDIWKGERGYEYWNVPTGKAGKKYIEETAWSAKDEDWGGDDERARKGDEKWSTTEESWTDKDYKNWQAWENWAPDEKRAFTRTAGSGSSERVERSSDRTVTAPITRRSDMGQSQAQKARRLSLESKSKDDSKGREKGKGKGDAKGKGKAETSYGDDEWHTNGDDAWYEQDNYKKERYAVTTGRRNAAGGEGRIGKHDKWTNELEDYDKWTNKLEDYDKWTNELEDYKRQYQEFKDKRDRTADEGKGKQRSKGDPSDNSKETSPSATPKGTGREDTSENDKGRDSLQDSRREEKESPSEKRKGKGPGRVKVVGAARTSPAGAHPGSPSKTGRTIKPLDATKYPESATNTTIRKVGRNTNDTNPMKIDPNGIDKTENTVENSTKTTARIQDGDADIQHGDVEMTDASLVETNEEDGVQEPVDEEHFKDMPDLGVVGEGGSIGTKTHHTCRLPGLDSALPAQVVLPKSSGYLGGTEQLVVRNIGASQMKGGGGIGSVDAAESPTTLSLTAPPGLIPPPGLDLIEETNDGARFADGTRIPHGVADGTDIPGHGAILDGRLPDGSVAPPPGFEWFQPIKHSAKAPASERKGMDDSTGAKPVEDVADGTEATDVDETGVNTIPLLEDTLNGLQLDPQFISIERYDQFTEQQKAMKAAGKVHEVPTLSPPLPPNSPIPAVVSPLATARDESSLQKDETSESTAVPVGSMVNAYTGLGSGFSSWWPGDGTGAYDAFYSPDGTFYSPDGIMYSADPSVLSLGATPYFPSGGFVEHEFGGYWSGGNWAGQRPPVGYWLVQPGERMSMRTAYDRYNAKQKEHAKRLQIAEKARQASEQEFQNEEARRQSPDELVQQESQDELPKLSKEEHAADLLTSLKAKGVAGLTEIAKANPASELQTKVLEKQQEELQKKQERLQNTAAQKGVLRSQPVPWGYVAVPVEVKGSDGTTQALNGPIVGAKDGAGQKASVSAGGNAAASSGGKASAVNPATGEQGTGGMTVAQIFQIKKAEAKAEKKAKEGSNTGTAAMKEAKAEQRNQDLVRAKRMAMFLQGITDDGGEKASKPETGAQSSRGSRAGEQSSGTDAQSSSGPGTPTQTGKLVPATSYLQTMIRMGALTDEQGKKLAEEAQKVTDMVKSGTMSREDAQLMMSTKTMEMRSENAQKWGGWFTPAMTDADTKAQANGMTPTAMMSGMQARGMMHPMSAGMGYPGVGEGLYPGMIRVGNPGMGYPGMWGKGMYPGMGYPGMWGKGMGGMITRPDPHLACQQPYGATWKNDYSAGDATAYAREAAARASAFRAHVAATQAQWCSPWGSQSGWGPQHGQGWNGWGQQEHGQEGQLGQKEQEDWTDEQMAQWESGMKEWQEKLAKMNDRSGSGTDDAAKNADKMSDSSEYQKQHYGSADSDVWGNPPVADAGTEDDKNVILVGEGGEDTMVITGDANGSQMVIEQVTEEQARAFQAAQEQAKTSSALSSHFEFNPRADSDVADKAGGQPVIPVDVFDDPHIKMVGLDHDGLRMEEDGDGDVRMTDESDDVEMPDGAQSPKSPRRQDRTLDAWKGWKEWNQIYKKGGDGAETNDPHGSSSHRRTGSKEAQAAKPSIPDVKPAGQQLPIISVAQRWASSGSKKQVEGDETPAGAAGGSTGHELELIKDRRGRTYSNVSAVSGSTHAPSPTSKGRTESFVSPASITPQMDPETPHLVFGKIDSPSADGQEGKDSTTTDGISTASDDRSDEKQAGSEERPRRVSKRPALSPVSGSNEENSGGASGNNGSHPCFAPIGSSPAGVLPTFGGGSAVGVRGTAEKADSKEKTVDVEKADSKEKTADAEKADSREKTADADRTASNETHAPAGETRRGSTISSDRGYTSGNMAGKPGPNTLSVASKGSSRRVTPRAVWNKGSDDAEVPAQLRDRAQWPTLGGGGVSSGRRKMTGGVGGAGGRNPLPLTLKSPTEEAPTQADGSSAAGSQQKPPMHRQISIAWGGQRSPPSKSPPSSAASSALSGSDQQVGYVPRLMRGTPSESYADKLLRKQGETKTES